MTLSSQPEAQAKSLGQIFESIPQHVNVEQLRGVNAVIQIRATGSETGEWVIAATDQACTVRAEKAASPDLVITATSDVWRSLLYRKLDPAWAFMSGQVQVSGDLGLAMRLQALLNLA